MNERMAQSHGITDELPSYCSFSGARSDDLGNTPGVNFRGWRTDRLLGMLELLHWLQEWMDGYHSLRLHSLGLSRAF